MNPLLSIDAFRRFLIRFFIFFSGAALLLWGVGNWLIRVRLEQRLVAGSDIGLIIDIYSAALVLIAAVGVLIAFFLGLELVEPFSVAFRKVQESATKRDLQESRERAELRVLLSMTSEAIVVVDLDGGVLIRNDPFLNLFETKRQDKEQASRLTDFFRDPQVVELFQAALRSGEQGRLDWEMPSKAGITGKVFLSVAVSPLIDEKEGRVFGALGVFVDISVFKKREVQQGEWISDVSHEMRTPLTSLQGYLLTVEQDIKEHYFEDLATCVVAMQRSVRRLLELSSDLIDLSKNSALSTLVLEGIPLRPLCEEALVLVQEAIGRKRQKILLDITVEAIVSDRKRLLRVLTNLIENASKYSPEQTEITVRWQEDGVKQKIYFSVEDQGPGIEAMHVDRVFDRFYRIEAHRSRDTGGSGLGLAIVKQAVESLDGKVWVEATQDGGSRFVCEFKKRTQTKGLET